MGDIDLTPLTELICETIPLELICPQPAPEKQDSNAPVQADQPGVTGPPDPAGGPTPATGPLVGAPLPATRDDSTSQIAATDPSVQDPLPATRDDSTYATPPTAAVVSAAQSDSINGNKGPGSGSLGLREPDEVDLSPVTVAVAAAISFLGLILIGFPAELFNRTFRENYAQVSKLLPWIAKQRSRRSLSWQVMALIVSSAIAGLIGVLQKVRDWDPGEALSVAVALGVGFLVTTGLYEVASELVARRLKMASRQFSAYPGALPIVALFVGISTAGSLQPAYVYGHIAGARADDSDSVDLRGRALQTTAAASTLFVFALACWGLRAVTEPSLLDDVLAGIVVVALNRLVFALIPVTFLAGAAPFRYNRLLWACLYTPTLIAFLTLILLPAVQTSGAAPAVASLLLFGLFGGLSLALWAFFKRRQDVVMGAAA